MDQDLKRRPEENQDQYFYRLCKMKDVLGFTWPQMTELFNNEFGNDCGESKYRKDWAEIVEKENNKERVRRYRDKCNENLTIQN